MRQEREASDKHQFALIAVGSNQVSIWGSPQNAVVQAARVLSDRLDAHVQASRLYATPAFPAGAGPDFVNAAFRVETMLAPQMILEVLHAIEAEAGRTRDVRWGQRTLDLDLIAVGDAVLPDAHGFAMWRDLSPEDQQKKAPEQLILPHPRLQDRAFVLVPLADVAPDWVHPVLGDTVTQMRDALPAADRAAVTALD